MKILVTGANSQLALTIKDHIEYYKESLDDEYVFCKHNELDITDINSIYFALDFYNPDIIVNCAAYTNVEKAETEFKKTIEVNCFGVENLVKACEDKKIFLIHISTDYVYKSIYDCAVPSKGGYGLREESPLDPISKYALSKYLGEKMCIGHNGIIIIRTSWLYSIYGKNFVKTIVNKIKNNEDISVVDDQFGRPTNCDDLADFIVFAIIARRKFELEMPCDIYNFQNSGDTISWFNFACAIYNFYTNKYAMPYSYHEAEGMVKRISTNELNSLAVRPTCTTMDITKAFSIGMMNINQWEISLRDFITRNRCII